MTPFAKPIPAELVLPDADEGGQSAEVNPLSASKGALVGIFLGVVLWTGILSFFLPIFTR